MSIVHRPATAEALDAAEASAAPLLMVTWFGVAGFTLVLLSAPDLPTSIVCGVGAGLAAAAALALTVRRARARRRGSRPDRTSVDGA